MVNGLFVPLTFEGPVEEFIHGYSCYNRNFFIGKYNQNALISLAKHYIKMKFTY